MKDVDVVEMGSYRRAAFLGGIYSNHRALKAALGVAREQRADAIVALGDFGAFGPHPDRTIEILRTQGIPAIRGNYEESLATDAADCRCGYTDPRDNHFAGLSYDYTKEKTSPEHKAWMGTLPAHRRLSIGGRRVLACHGSPRRVNEFLWSSTTPAPFIGRLLDEHDTDLIVCTHTGLHWSRLIDEGRGVINAGALGRPANDGRTEVWMAIVESGPDGRVVPRFLQVAYEHEALAREMEDERLPAPFIETIRTGWWTTCLEILPAKERAAGRF